MVRVHIALVCVGASASTLFAQVGSGLQQISQHRLSTPTALYAWSETRSKEAALSAPAPAPPAAPGPPLVLHTAVHVEAREGQTPLTEPPSTVDFTGNDVLVSAGTWSDLPRYLQTLPGLIGGADSQNASFVRGGNSFENLFVVDHIEVPNINQLALDNSTGGLGSMLDTEMVGNVVFQSGAIDSNFDSHMSSLTEIHTLEPGPSFTAAEIGYSGAGVRLSRSIGRTQSLLVSARESVTNLFLRDVGLNGSPEFTNAFARYAVDLTSRDHLRLESLGGRDSLRVRPSQEDLYETNAYNTDYSGWRDTTGFVWQHTHRNEAVSSWTASASHNVQHLLQVGQMDESGVLLQNGELYQNSITPPQFQQNTQDGVGVLKYDYQYVGEDGSGSRFGADTHISRVHYNTAQTGDLYSPYSAAGSAPIAAFSQAPYFVTVARATYADLNQAVGHRLFLRGGLRLQSSGFATGAGASTVWLPHGSASVAAGLWNLQLSYHHSAQLPPYATIAGAPGNTQLGYIHAQQVTAGVVGPLGHLFTLRLEGYRKLYTGYPVSVDYPEVSLATMLPVINEPFAALTMRSQGRGRTEGVELSVEQALCHGLFTRANVTWSRGEFTGLDGIYRVGSNDLPLVANLMAGARIRRYTVTARETITSGRPYTPVLAQASYYADRAVFDLSQLNALRGPLYSRLDVAVNREFTIREGVLRVHAGALNLQNRKNFYEYFWRPRDPFGGMTAEYGTGLRPDFSISFTF